MTKGLCDVGGTGQNCRLPVIPAGDMENFKIESVKLRESPKDMLFDTMREIFMNNYRSCFTEVPYFEGDRLNRSILSLLQKTDTYTGSFVRIGLNKPCTERQLLKWRAKLNALECVRHFLIGILHLYVATVLFLSRSKSSRTEYCQK